MTYEAVVARIRHHAVEGLDNLLVGECLGYQVLVGKDTPQDALGVFFEGGGQLSEEFCHQNDLIKRKDENGVQVGGMFEVNRRVKAITMRGHRSEGYWCPLSCFSYTGVNEVFYKENTTFSKLGEHDICNKYITEATKREQRIGQSTKTKKVTAFIEHDETMKFKMLARFIPIGSLCTITEKLHGTSHRVGYVMDETPVKRHWLMKPFEWIFRLPMVKKELRILNGTRKTVIEKKKKTNDDGFYGSDEFRLKLTRTFQDMIEPGEIIFGEIVGYVSEDKTIMARHSTSSLKNKSAKKEFGETVTYSYGCKPGEAKFYVYRITDTDDKGKIYDVGYDRVITRTLELGLENPPYLSSFFIEDETHLEKMYNDVELLTNGNDGKILPSTVDPSHPMEGVVIRIDTPDNRTYWLKNKSFAFGVMEGYEKDFTDSVDMEEVS